MKKPEHKFTYETLFILHGEEQLMSSGSYYEQTHFIFQAMKEMLEGFFQARSRTKLTFTIERELDEKEKSLL